MILVEIAAKNDKFGYLNPILGKLRVTRNLGWWLVGNSAEPNARRFFCSAKTDFRTNWTTPQIVQREKAFSFSLQRALPLTPEQGLCAWTPLSPDPRYRTALRAYDVIPQTLSMDPLVEYYKNFRDFGVAPRLPDCESCLRPWLTFSQFRTLSITTIQSYTYNSAIPRNLWTDSRWN